MLGYRTGRLGLADRQIGVRVRRVWLAAGVVSALVSLTTGSLGLAQPNPKVPTNGAFAKLSAGNQKVARSLHHAQKARMPALNATGPASVKPLTLDELAAKNLSGQPWISIFKDMKAQGLVQERSLGEVVSKYGQVAETGARTVPLGGAVSALGIGSYDFGGIAAHGNGKGGE
jgi:hypothetical protein